MGERVSDVGEAGLLARLFEMLPRAGGVVIGPGDDAAVVAVPPLRDLVLTTDAMVEGVHFDRRYMSSEDVGWRLACANLSDLAAMGARPAVAVVALAVPPATATAEVEGFYRGLTSLGCDWGLTIVGGDVVASPGPWFAAMAAVGWGNGGAALTRGGARPGDVVAVTGEVGLAAAGWDLTRWGKVTEGSAAAAAARRFLRPVPRLALGESLARNRWATAGIDTSDSLSTSVHHIARASGVGFYVRAQDLPLAAAAREVAAARGQDPVDYAVAGGEDFELLVTLRAEFWGEVRAAAAREGTAITVIGEVTAAADGVVLERGGRAEKWEAAGFAHF